MDFTSYRLSENFDRAFALASRLHREQKRKNISCPFMAHLMSVAALVCENIGFVCSTPEECEVYVTTAILHDTIEDQGGKATYDLLELEFGKQIAENVKALSDSMPDDPSQKPPKSVRNQLYLEHLTDAPIGIVLVSCCDKIHNLRTMAADAKATDNLDLFWSAFTQKPEPTVENYKRLRDKYAQRLPGNRLIQIYDEALEAVVKLLPKHD